MGKVQRGEQQVCWQNEVNLCGIPVGYCRVCTHRLGLELGVDLVQAGVEAPEGADVLLIIPGHLVGVTLCLYMRGGNERADQ